MKKIRVVIATNFLGIGGAERTVQTLAMHIDRSRFDLTVLCLEAGGPRQELLEGKGVRVLIGDGTLEKIKELLPEPQVDILHFHRSGEYTPLHTAAMAYLRPKKLMETNIFAFTDTTIHFDLQIYKSMMMLSERIRGGRRPEPDACLTQRVIYNPVTVDYFEQFRLTEAQRADLRRNLGITPDTVVLGRVGRNDPTKWGDLILTALPKLLQDNPKIKVLFLTIPSSRLGWLKRHNFFDGRVVVLPESNSEKEIAETYQIMDMYVHTSRRGEAFGNSLNEAMVWSLPIVVENTPHWDNGQLEQVEHGSTGWVVRSVGGMIGAIEDLAHYSDRRRMFGENGRHKVNSNFGLARGIKQYELAYEQLAGVVDAAHVCEAVYPTTDDIAQFCDRYKQLQQLDYHHPASRCLDLKKIIDYWQWRVIDSLVARGFL